MKNIGSELRELALVHCAVLGLVCLAFLAAVLPQVVGPVAVVRETSEVGFSYAE